MNEYSLFHTGSPISHEEKHKYKTLSGAVIRVHKRKTQQSMIRKGSDKSVQKVNNTNSI